MSSDSTSHYSKIKIKVGRVYGHHVLVKQGKLEHEAILLGCDDDPESFLAHNKEESKRVKIKWKIAGYNDYAQAKDVRLQTASRRLTRAQRATGGSEQSRASAADCSKVKEETSIVKAAYAADEDAEEKKRNLHDNTEEEKRSFYDRVEASARGRNGGDKLIPDVVSSFNAQNAHEQDTDDEGKGGNIAQTGDKLIPDLVSSFRAQIEYEQDTEDEDQEGRFAQTKRKYDVPIKTEYTSDTDDEAECIFPGSAGLIAQCGYRQIRVRVNAPKKKSWGGEKQISHRLDDSSDNANDSSGALDFVSISDHPSASERDTQITAVPAEGLPDGWLVRHFPRLNQSKAKSDPSYYSPKLGFKFRSRKEALRFVDEVVAAEGDEAAAITAFCGGKKKAARSMDNTTNNAAIKPAARPREDPPEPLPEMGPVDVDSLTAGSRIWVLAKGERWQSTVLRPSVRKGVPGFAIHYDGWGKKKEAWVSKPNVIGGIVEEITNG